MDTPSQSLQTPVTSTSQPVALTAPRATVTASSYPPINPLPNLLLLITALGHKSRWKLLKEMTHGEPRTLRELAKACGCTPWNTSKHLAMLRQLGLVVQGRGRLYQIPAQYLPQPGKPLLECGHCLLRMDAVE